jgi:hypothetical protein
MKPSPVIESTPYRQYLRSAGVPDPPLDHGRLVYNTETPLGSGATALGSVLVLPRSVLYWRYRAQFCTEGASFSTTRVRAGERFP